MPRKSNFTENGGTTTLTKRQADSSGLSHSDNKAIHLQIENYTEEELQSMSFLQRINIIVNASTIDRSHLLVSFFLASCMFWFCVISNIFIAWFYYIPWIMSEYQLPSSSEFWLRIFIGFLTFQIACNWLCTICYTSTMDGKHPFIRSPRHLEAIRNAEEEDRPWLRKTLWMDYDEALKQCQIQRNFITNIVKNKGVRSGSSYMLLYEVDEENGLQWKHCLVCKKDVPPRAHHCPICGVCILKRDHHCYMSGVCIGYYNQRYFIVGSFYTAISVPISLWCNYNCLRSSLFSMEYFHWGDLLLPITVVKWLFGTSMSTFHLVLILHWYISLPVGMMAFAFFLFHWMSVLKGQTVHELRKNEDVRTDLPVNHRLSDVFGHLWFLNFLFPSQIIFPQVSDGRHWPGVYHSGNMKRKNTSRP